MPAAHFVSSRVRLGELSFHYLDWGGDGPPFVMLHGLTSHARTWDHTAAALSGQYRVLVLDQRGHGDSDWAARYGLGPMVEDLVGFMDALGLPEITVMGLSMGGAVGYLFAAAHPERVRRLLVLDMGPEIAPAGHRRLAAELAGSSIFSSEDEAFARARAANARPTDEALRHRISHNLRPLPDGTLTFKCDEAVRDLDAIRDRAADEQWAAWRAVNCPILLVRGDDSDILDAETARRMLAENPNASLAVIADCGHGITLDRPEALLNTVNRWLAATAVSA